MRKFLLLLFVACATCNYSFSQGGHVWTFGSGSFPLPSTPTSGLSAVNLTKLGSGTVTMGTSDGGWTSTCTTGVTTVATFAIGSGFEFPADVNNPVGANYTIEMIFKLGSAENLTWRKLLGFVDLNSSDPTQIDNCIYVDDFNNLTLYVYGNTNQSIGSLSVDTWYHLVFVRNDATDTVTVYQNNTVKGKYYDPANDLVPRTSNSDKISFFKDDNGTYGGEETSGKVAKIAIYNQAFNSTKVAELYTNACSATPATPAPVAGPWKLDGNADVGESGFLGTTNDKPLVIKTNSTEAMRVLSGGQVGIGTATVPTGYKLAVKGNVLAEKLVVRLHANWPDYVFDSTYQLPTIQEVSDYIRKHKHLPGVPSAAEVQDKGVDVGDQQTILLRKVEELTLYIIAQEQRIKALEQALQNQPSRKQKKNRQATTR